MAASAVQKPGQGSNDPAIEGRVLIRGPSNSCVAMSRNPWPMFSMAKYCFVDAPLLRGVLATLLSNEWRAR